MALVGDDQVKGVNRDVELRGVVLNCPLSPPR